MYVIFNQQLYMFTQFIYTCIKRHNKAGFWGFKTYDLLVLLDFFLKYVYVHISDQQYNTLEIETMHFPE